MSVTLEVELLDNYPKDLGLPSYGTLGAAGFDLMAAEDCYLAPGDKKIVSTGLRVKVPHGHCLQVLSRSGLSATWGLFVLNSPGIIDSDYRGEVKVILANFGKEAFDIRVGTRIAQAMVLPVPYVYIAEVDKIANDTERGTGGFGSTGM